MRALVTGGAGFIGGHLCMDLLLRGHSVRALDDLSSGRRANLEECLGHPGSLGFVEGGVAEERALREALGSIDTVFHLATRPGVQFSLDDPASSFANDVAVTFRLLEEARHRKLRFVYCSSALVYGTALPGEAQDERRPLHPASPQAGCKAAAEALILSYARSYGLRATVVRPFNVYGPGQRADCQGGVVAAFCRRALSGLPLIVHGDGEQTRDFIYVDDCVRLLCQAGERDEAIGEIINAGSGQAVSITELAGRVREAPFAHPGMAVAHLDHPHMRCEIRRMLADTEKATHLLHWLPQVGLDDGLGRTAAWLRNKL